MSAITNPNEFVEHTTAMALEEKAKLQKHFTRFDIYFFLICTIVGVDTLGQVAANGAQGFTWLLFLAVFFFVPYALLTAELGAAFTGEGGATSGRGWRAAGSCRRQRGLLLVLQPDLDRRHARAPEIATVHEFFFSIGDNSWRSTSSASRTSGSRSIRPSSRSGSASGSRRSGPGPDLRARPVRDQHDYLRVQERPHFPSGGEFKPTYALFIALVPLLFFNYVGFELPSAAGDEMEDPQKDVPYTVLRAASPRSCCTACRSLRSSRCFRRTRSPASTAS